MKNIISTPTTLPVANIMTLVSTILSHAANMNKINNDYKLAKQKMRQEYLLEEEKLHNNMQAFRLMAKQQRAYFSQHHKERMQLLVTVEKITENMCHLTDTNALEALHKTIEVLISTYTENITHNVSFLEHNQILISRGV